MLVKNKVARTHVNDLREVFATLQKYQIKLNPTRYAFGVASGKFLDFIVSSRGVEANPKKIKPIYNMGPPRIIKDI